MVVELTSGDKIEPSPTPGGLGVSSWGSAGETAVIDVHSRFVDPAIAPGEARLGMKGVAG